MAKAFVKEEADVKEVIPVKKKVVEEKPLIKKGVIGVISIKDKLYQLITCDDKKWYKREAIGETQFDELRNTPKVVVWSDEITPLTKKEFESYFGKSK